MTYLSLKLGLRKAQEEYLKSQGVSWSNLIEMEKEALDTIEPQEIDGYRIEVEEKETYAYTVVGEANGYQVCQRMPLGITKSIHIHKVRDGGKK